MVTLFSYLAGVLAEQFVVSLMQLVTQFRSFCQITSGSIASIQGHGLYLLTRF